MSGLTTPPYAGFAGYNPGGGLIGNAPPPSVKLDEQAKIDGFMAASPPGVGILEKGIQNENGIASKDIAGSMSEGLNKSVHIPSNGMADKDINKNDLKPKIENISFAEHSGMNKEASVRSR